MHVLYKMLLKPILHIAHQLFDIITSIILVPPPERPPTEGGIFEARVSPGSFLYLYIFLHLFHVFSYILFVFFV